MKSAGGGGGSAILQISPRRQPPSGVSAAEIIGYNEDVLTQILIHLPFKSLGKFRCVSKRWNSLITHHLPPRLYPPCGILFLMFSGHNKQYEYVTLDTNRNAPFSSPTLVDELAGGMYIVRSTNGLLLLRNPRADYGDYYCVYSPITKQKRVLPRLDDSLYNVCLAYDPLISTANYKVIGMCKLVKGPDRKSQCEIVIYSSETGLWRVFNIRSPVPFSNRQMIYLNDAVYWVGEGGYKDYRGFCFYLDGEQVRDFQVPAGYFTYFWECRGRLYAVVKELEEEEVVIGLPPIIRGMWFDVYEMGTQYTEWSLKHNIDVSPFMKDKTHYASYDLQFLFLIREENEDDCSAMLNYTRGQILRYNFQNKTFTEFSDNPCKGEVCLYMEVLTFL
ncbi:hypothetical protein Tsubulata_016942 [Turnera subulata]|uniref:F-box domain-containing protein n=1 Tax=Turnera subulata TaxID=218843 RepID=A0A9Q0J717_9ROSI|nr:hypothetical protein Tsubulata_016942 [Turnera subulata]